MYARSLIDSLDFARKGRKSSGEVQLDKMPRLLEFLESPQGMLSYTLSGGVGDQGSSFLDLSVNGNCQLRCQRCLRGMDYQVQLVAHLLLSEQEGLDVLDSEIEGFDSILADAKLDVLSLLEDEVLLSLPIAPKHEPGTCQPAVGENGLAKERHPFAALAKLKRN